MFQSTGRLSRRVAGAVAVVALAVPGSSAAYRAEDLRSPNTVDAATQARQAALDVRRAQPGYQDLRNPDTRDAENAALSGAVADAPPAREVAGGGGFDWGDAGIGAGSALGLALIAASVMLAVAHRRSRSARRGAVTT